MADVNIRELQAGVVRGLEALGMPDPRANAIVQVQWRENALFAVVRFRSLKQARWLVNSGLMPEIVVSYLGAAYAPRERIMAWAEQTVAVDAYALAHTQMLAKGFPWPHGWPVPHVRHAMSALPRG